MKSVGGAVGDRDFSQQTFQPALFPIRAAGTSTQTMGDITDEHASDLAMLDEDLNSKFGSHLESKDTPRLLDSSTEHSILNRPLITIEVENNGVVVERLLDEAKRKGASGQYHRDSRWQLVAAMQASLLGQFVQSLERAAVKCANKSNSVTASPLAAQSTAWNSNIWENVLRGVCSKGCLLQDYTAPAATDCTVTIEKTKSQDVAAKGEGYKPRPESFLFTLLHVRYSETSLPSDRSIISDFALTRAFLFEATCQVSYLWR